MEYKQELTKIYEAKTPVYSDELLSKDIILYGGGSLGHMAVTLLKEGNITPRFVLDKSVRCNINGIQVLSPDNITEAAKREFLFLVCISTLPYNEIEAFLTKCGCKNAMHFYTWAYLKIPDLLGNGWFQTDLNEDEKTEIEQICSSLAHDDLSLAHYLQFLWWKLRLKEVIYSDYPVLSGKKYFNTPSLPELNSEESLLDAGAHFGQSLSDFSEAVKGRFNHIWAFEPDLSSQKTLKENVSSDILEKTILYDEALSDKCEPATFKNGLGYASKVDDNGNQPINTVTLDSLLEIKPSIIKLHIEGHELKALYGARQTIEKCRPIIMVLADHSPDGLYKIPRFLHALDNYRLFFNLHDYCGNSAIFYAYPVERLGREKNA